MSFGTFLLLSRKKLTQYLAMFSSNRYSKEQTDIFFHTTIEQCVVLNGEPPFFSFESLLNIVHY